MIFNSLSYFIFLPIVFLCHYFLADRYRWLLLVVSSYVFYGFLLEPVLPVVLAAVTLISYYTGNLLDVNQDPLKRRRMLYCGVAANLSILGYFKYVPFIIANVNSLLKILSVAPPLQVPAPLTSIALSFFIFQAISYMADIYFRLAKPEPHFGHFAVYMSFFPKLLQGPIERAEDFLPQLRSGYVFDYEKVRSGLLLFSWGLFKKVAVADRLAPYVDRVYNDVHAYSGISLAVATYAYAFQLYFDFAGYTDMARGTGRLFGLEIVENFNKPYLATSCAEFWRRWHMSFSKWILEYIFEPLQMKLRGLDKAGIALSLLGTFIVAGLWHGPSWCFIVYGLIHGIYLASSLYYKPYQKKLHKKLGIQKSPWLKWWQILVTFHLVCFSDIFFRANSLADALYVVRNLGDIGANIGVAEKIGVVSAANKLLFMGRGAIDLLSLLIALGVVFMVSVSAIELRKKPAPFRWLCYYGLGLALMILGATGHSSYIYFNF